MVLYESFLRKNGRNHETRHAHNQCTLQPIDVCTPKSADVGKALLTLFCPLPNRQSQRNDRTSQIGPWSIGTTDGTGTTSLDTTTTRDRRCFSLVSNMSFDIDEQPQSFTPIQTNRRLPQSICSVALCPTMDLIAVGLGGSSSSSASGSLGSNRYSSTIAVFRTISWQKMFSIAQSDLVSAAADAQDELDGDHAVHDHEEISTAIIGGTNLTWSPDGRILAVALTNGVLLCYDIESCASPGMPPTPIFSLPCLSLASEVCSEPTPLGTSEATLVEEKNNGNSTRSYSPILTRSMTDARRKRLMRMAGKTPSKHKEKEEEHTMNVIHQQAKENSHSRCLEIKSVCWKRIRQRHDQEWYFRKYYLDRSSFFLPPCHYTMNETHGMNVIAGDSMHLMNQNKVFGSDGSGGGHKHAFPSAKNPLSMLAVFNKGALLVYLNGRYRIVSMPLISNETKYDSHSVEKVHLVLTSNFHILTTQQASKESVRYMLYNFPTLVGHRYNLQVISSSYMSICHHISTMKCGMEETQNAWCAALRQLDMKFDQLLNLLKKYYVIKQDSDNQEELMRNELLKYILGGHSTRSSDCSNAMDQFFTHPMMNDQLLVRLFRSVVASVAGVESLFRKKILAPCRSFLFDVEELHGLGKAMNRERKYACGDLLSATGTEDNFPGSLPALMDDGTCERLCEAVKILYMISEQCVCQIVEMRYRLECLTKWIRATASQVKARGTAADSVQRENARTRRISDQIVQKVATFLATPLKSASCELGQKRGLTESVLGVLLLDYFLKDAVYFEKMHDPLTPTQSNSSHSHSKEFHKFVETPSLKAALAVSRDIASELFCEPRTVMSSMMEKREIIVEEVQNQSNIISATHSRFVDEMTVQNALADDHLLDSDAGSNHKKCNCIIISNTCSSQLEHRQLVQITAIPVPDSDCLLFYKTAFVQLPLDCTVVNMQFYGDDGDSTLTSESSPSFEEGRQSLGLLLRRKLDEDRENEELWMFEYDGFIFQKVGEPFDSTEMVVRSFDPSMDTVERLTLSEIDGIESKWRCTKSVCIPNNITDLTMSGSRGIAALWCADERVIDIYDIEEDEESSESSEM